MILFTGVMTLFATSANAGTCSSISRTNAAANSILTSTTYNADLNTVYAAANALDGGCITSGTLEADSLNTTDFAVPLNAIREGCKVTRSAAATLSIDKCFLAVNGEWVRTTSATTATWGCTDCSSESNSTTYYLYAKDGSTGSTLTPLISTTAPNNDGYDASNNRVLAKFYNASSGDIYSSVNNWGGFNFAEPYDYAWLITGLGHGSTANKIRTYATVDVVGTALSVTQSSTNGDLITVGEDGLYEVQMYDINSGGTVSVGASVNADSDLTTSLFSLAIDNVIFRYQDTDTTDMFGTVIRRFFSGDKIRCHDTGSNDSTTSERAWCKVTKISN